MDQNLTKELETLKTAVASAEKKFVELSAAKPKPADPEDDENAPDDENDMEDRMERMNARMDALGGYVNHVYSYASKVQDNMSQYCQSHAQNHTPALKPSAMEKFLKMVGMDGDYVVQKPTIRCTATKNGSVISVDYTTPKK